MPSFFQESRNKDMPSSAAGPQRRKRGRVPPRYPPTGTHSHRAHSAEPACWAQTVVARCALSHVGTNARQRRGRSAEACMAPGARTCEFRFWVCDDGTERLLTRTHLGALSGVLPAVGPVDFCYSNVFSRMREGMGVRILFRFCC